MCNNNECPHTRVCSDGHVSAGSGERAITSVQAPELLQSTLGDTGQQWSHLVTRRHLSHTQTIYCSGHTETSTQSYGDIQLIYTENTDTQSSVELATNIWQRFHNYKGPYY